MTTLDDAPTTSTATGGGVRDYRLLLPPGWVRIPIDDRTAERLLLVAKQHVDAEPPHRREVVRTRLLALLRTAVDEAARAGSVDLLISLGRVGDLPVLASCMVATLDPQGLDLAALTATWRQEHPGDDLAVVRVAGADAVRRESTRVLTTTAEEVARVADAADVDLTGRSVPQPTVRELTWFVPVPGLGRLLTFSFSFPQPALAGALVELADAMMSTLRWVA